MRLPRRMLLRAALLACTLGLFGFGADPAGAQQKIGIVLLHGKQGSPETGARLRVHVIGGLADALGAAGYLVERPEMCWSANRIYDATFIECFGDIDDSVARLKSRGASSIVVMGMSIGGNAVLGYGARRDGLKGIVAIAAAGPPEIMVKRPEIARSLDRAKAMVAAGKGEDKDDFADNNDGPFTVRTKAKIYTSFFGPGGPANMAVNMRQLRAPLLMVSGNSDPGQTYTRSLFASAPANPLNRLVTVDSGHLGTPNAGTEAILAWLKELPPG